jgi:hypothetical protein
MTTILYYWILTDENGITTEFRGDLYKLSEIITPKTVSIVGDIDFYKLH